LAFAAARCYQGDNDSDSNAAKTRERQMGLNAHVTQKVRTAALAFADQVAEIVSTNLRAEFAEDVKKEISRFLEGSPRARAGNGVPARTVAVSAGTPSHRRRRAARYDGSAVDRLVAVIKASGGVGHPAVVSKELRLSPEQRRRLVRAAVAAGVVHTTGERRNTRYVLASVRRPQTAKRA
jgi:hypothetical protein